MNKRHPSTFPPRSGVFLVSLRRVGKANGSRECAPDGVPTMQTMYSTRDGGHGARAPLPTLRFAARRGLLEEVTMFELIKGGV
jgi:hypothetical protein